MNTSENEKFKIGLEESDEQVRTDDIPMEAGIANIQRLRIPSIVLALVFAALFAFIFFVYLSLSIRINAITKAGETRIKTVSTGVGDRFTATSQKIDGIKKDLEKQIFAIESRGGKNKESIHALFKKISALSKTVNEVAKTRKKISGIKAYLESMKTVNTKAVAKIKKHLKTIDGLISGLATQMDTLSGINDQLDALAKRVEDLSATDINKEQMQAAIDTMNENIAQLMDKADSRHARELSAIRSEISRLKKSVSAATPPRTNSPAPNTAKGIIAPAPAQTTPGRIIEQEIK